MKHKHAELMLRYAQDAQETETPWERWEANQTNNNSLWFTLSTHPFWAHNINYRRKPDCHNRDYLKHNGGECVFSTCKHHCKDEPLCNFEPQKKVVDLSVLIGSGIDCDFGMISNDGSISQCMIAPLVGINLKARCKYEAMFGDSYEVCRPRMDHWHSWQGGECPLPEGFKVVFVFRNGTDSALLSNSVVHEWEYDEQPHNHDIIAFRVIGLADDYCYPWEVK